MPAHPAIMRPLRQVDPGTSINAFSAATPHRRSIVVPLHGDFDSFSFHPSQVDLIGYVASTGQIPVQSYWGTRLSFAPLAPLERRATNRLRIPAFGSMPIGNPEVAYERSHREDRGAQRARCPRLAGFDRSPRIRRMVSREAGRALRAGTGVARAHRPSGL